MVVAEGGGKEVEREIEFYVRVDEEGNGCEEIFEE